MRRKYKTFDCRWDPDCDLNGIGPMDPDPLNNPSQQTRKRNRRFLEMLLTYPSVQSIAQADRILAGYPYLREEWGPRITAACHQLLDEARARLRDLDQ